MILPFYVFFLYLCLQTSVRLIMPNESRLKKSLLNAKVNLCFYLLGLILSFFSRKVFLNVLGADFLGLSSTLLNLLGFLNLAELGIGSAIGYVLYKPLYEEDKEKICEIISVFGDIHRCIGFIILGSRWRCQSARHQSFFLHRIFVFSFDCNDSLH